MKKIYKAPNLQCIELETATLVAASIDLKVSDDETQTVSDQTDLWGNQRHNDNPIWNNMD